MYTHTCSHTYTYRHVFVNMCVTGGCAFVSWLLNPEFILITNCLHGGKVQAWAEAPYIHCSDIFDEDG